MLILRKVSHKKAMASSSGCCVGIYYLRCVYLCFSETATETLQLMKGKKNKRETHHQKKPPQAHKPNQTKQHKNTQVMKTRFEKSRQKKLNDLKWKKTERGVNNYKLVISKYKQRSLEIQTLRWILWHHSQHISSHESQLEFYYQRICPLKFCNDTLPYSV